MPINLEWRDENGQMLAHYTGPFINSSLPGNASSDSRCLRFIDPWGNTIFNQLQVPVLVAELEEVVARSTDPVLRDNITAVLRFVQQNTDDVHTYLTFVGD